jgi:hypothetical protein
VVTRDGVRRTMTMVSTKAIITKVEKWDTTNTEVTTRVSGGGGYLHQGTGHIDGIRSTTTTRVTSQRNVRIYYVTEDGNERNLSVSGFDLDVTEGSPITIEWYQFDGIQELVAGFYNERNKLWYWFNQPSYFVHHWIGLSAHASVPRWSIAFLVFAIPLIAIPVSHYWRPHAPSMSAELCILLAGLGVGALFTFKRMAYALNLMSTNFDGRVVAADQYQAAVSYILSVAKQGIEMKYQLRGG